MEVLTLARHGDVKELVELTSSNKLNVNGRIELEEWNALQHAASEGDEPTVRTLLAAAADADFQPDTHTCPRHSALMIACRYGYVNVVQCLMTAGVDVNLADQYGYRALHYASACGHFRVVELLLHAGAHAPHRSTDGSSALDAALAQRHARIAELLAQYTKKYDDSGLRRLQSWLEVLGAGQYFDRFVQAGYDFDFTAQHGLNDDDLDCVGVPLSMLGLRKKLKALHRIGEFKDEEEEEEEEESEEEDSDEEDSDEEEEED